MKSIYKLDTKGKLRVLHVWTEGAMLCQSSGLMDGKLVCHKKESKPKNIGKLNVTTGPEQARFEMESLITDKLTKGYFNSIEEAEKGNVQLPMLAKDYKKEEHKIKWAGDVFIQPKLDGMRCLAHCSADGSVKLISRAGKPIENMDHIIKSLSKLKTDVILDGELYAHGEDFQRQMELIKKYREGETEKVKFHIYDVVQNLPFLDRILYVCEYITSKINDDFEPLVYVETTGIKNEKDLKQLHRNNIENGYEGSIVRHGNSGYKLNGRSDSLLKYKDFIDLALPIKDIIQNDAIPTHGTPVFEINGKSFKSGLKYSHERRTDFLTNRDQYIGQTAELRFFEYSNDGIPRFPVMVGIRLDK